MDQYTRRIVGLAVRAGVLDGPTVGRMLNRIFATALRYPIALSTDHDPLFEFHRWMANLRIVEVAEVKSVPLVPTSHPSIVGGRPHSQHAVGRRMSNGSQRRRIPVATSLSRPVRVAGGRITTIRHRQVGYGDGQRLDAPERQPDGSDAAPQDGGDGAAGAASLPSVHIDVRDPDQGPSTKGIGR